MEIHQFDPFSTHHQRANKNAQTGPIHSTHSELAKCPNVQACQTLHKKNRAASSSPIYLKHRKLQGPDIETKRHANSIPLRVCFP